MNLDRLPSRRIEATDRRVLGAFQLVDAVTALPVAAAAAIEVRGASVGSTPVDVALPRHAVRIRRNRGGRFIVFSAPFFDTYGSTFANPAAPAETAADPLRLRLAITDAGPFYLPQQFVFDLPRALDPDAAASVFEPVRVGVFRAPNATAQVGWALLRVRVTQAGTTPPAPLGGVLVRVFRSPRAGGAQPIGAGMTEWRGGVAGEALVPVTDVQRFRPGAGPHVIDTDQAIELEVSRHSGFTGAAGQLPDVAGLIHATGGGFIRPPSQPPGSRLTIVLPATAPPLRVQAGREYVVHLAMP